MSVGDALAALGASALVVALVGYLGKRVIDAWFEAGTQRFKIETQAFHDAQLERLRKELSAIEYEHQVRFSKLHERRIDVLEQVYVKLARTERAFQAWFRPLRLTGGSAVEEDAQIAVSAANELVEYVNVIGIWVPEDLMQDLRSFTSQLHRASIEFGMKDQLEGVQTWGKVLDTMEKEVAGLRKRIEGRARALLEPPSPLGGSTLNS